MNKYLWELRRLYTLLHMPYIFHVLDHIQPWHLQVQNKNLQFQLQITIHGMPFQQKLLEHMMKAQNEFQGKELNWFRILSYQHLMLHQILKKLLKMKQLGLLVYQGQYMLVFLYLSFFYKYHKQLHYLAQLRHRCVLIKSEQIKQSYKVQQQHQKFKGRDKW
ncbi:hypothetical protein PPERSA_07155 [Pseudocohnilembus persalinus]|uniref:Transmembrane protein n=1 Tax=Pseudocohnilembus persalinus TaxID=266149 RepID=A0A0V0QY73_PSEPJ|nr:hypothetical protein PPERSA_07155 [Pseudocohnilembus persalinus]|eukprot:KRX06992.1 hypothetical protein PPERSA_07155 [Pseudocohnilembus persalinus]